MKLMWIVLLGIYSQHLFSEVYAHLIGAHLPNERGDCNYSYLFEDSKPYTNIDGVCVAESFLVEAMSDPEKRDLLTMAIIELQNPEMLDSLNRWYERRNQLIEAYSVIVTLFDGDFFHLQDGSVLEKTDSKYLRNSRRNQQAILFRTGRELKICIERNVFNVNFKKEVKSHQNKRRLHGFTFRDIQARGCG